MSSVAFVEALESRTLFAATPAGATAFVGPDGTLYVTGDQAASNTITVGWNEAGDAVELHVESVGKRGVTRTLDATYSIDDVNINALVLRGGSKADTIIVDESYYSFEAPARISGGKGDDELHGGSGDDVIVGGAGNDYIDGWAGNDALYGGAGNDEVYGDDGDDTLWGGAGNDDLEGEDGDDVLYGIVGTDALYGGDGNDQFVVKAGTTPSADGDYYEWEDVLTGGPKKEAKDPTF